MEGKKGFFTEEWVMGRLVEVNKDESAGVTGYYKGYRFVGLN